MGPLRLEIEKELNARSERVKCVDLHPTEPWVLSCLYDGNMHIYNYATESVVKTFEVSDQPIRCGLFVPRKQWIICGCDDMFIRVYNYNTMEKLKTFEAHIDYIRSMAVHPTLPLLVTASDDMQIKLWDWERGWVNTMIFEGHAHYVMQVLFNPKDPNTFASASLDHTVKVWNIRSPVPNLTLEGHEKGVNCIDYYGGVDKPYLVSGGDDQLVKIWDYQTRNCVQTLEYHQHNVACVSFLGDRPLILSGSEDGSVVLWNSTTYRNESVLNYNLERCWSSAYIKSMNRIALGYDLGTIVLKMGKDEPIMSMEASGKVIYMKQTEVSTVNIRSADPAVLVDGERIPLGVKELGNTEIYPKAISHSPNGRFVSVCGDGEYIIYTALAWRNKSFGQADEVVWDNGVGEFATRRGPSDIRVFSKMFKERRAFQPGFPVEGIFGGNLLTIRSNEFVCFYDWETLQMIRRIDVVPLQIYWSSSNMVALATDTSFYILRFDRDALDAELDRCDGEIGPDGAEGAFQLQNEFGEKLVSGCWVGDCFIYTNSNNRLNYVVGSEICVLHHLDTPQYILGYLTKENRVFLADKELGIVSYQLNLAVLEYKTAIARGDMEAAAAVLPNVPKAEHNKLAKFLETQGMKEEALAIATDDDYRCELAIALGNLDLAAEICRSNPSELKWKQLGELATQQGRLELAQESMLEANDMASLLTLAAVKSDAKLLETVSARSTEANVMNISFLSHFMLGNISGCLNILMSSNRLPEAAVFARTYCPSEVPRIVELWRADLRKSGNVRTADILADPGTHVDLFDSFEPSLVAEKRGLEIASRLKTMPSTAYMQVKDLLNVDMATLLSQGETVDASGQDGDVPVDDFQGKEDLEDKPHANGIEKPLSSLVSEEMKPATNLDDEIDLSGLNVKDGVGEFGQQPQPST